MRRHHQIADPTHLDLAAEQIAGGAVKIPTTKFISMTKLQSWNNTCRFSRLCDFSLPAGKNTTWRAACQRSCVLL
jgi:hypothetical protein